jgi:V8-like Glu-specific endopeptidase
MVDLGRNSMSRMPARGFPPWFRKRVMSVAIKRSARRLLPTLHGIALLGAFGCAEEATPEVGAQSGGGHDERQVGAITARRVPDELVFSLLPGFERHADVFELGQVAERDDFAAMEQPVVTSEGPTAVDQPVTGRASMIVGRNGTQYVVDFALDQATSDAVQARLRAEHEALAKGMLVERDDDKPLLQRSVTGNSDTRVRQGLADGVTATSWMAAVGMLSNNNNVNTQVCTGTLIRPNIVLTAAHCLLFWDSAANQSAVRQLSFSPRADNTQQTPKYPWGTWTWASSYYYPTAYQSNNCHKSYTSACQAFDWALVKVNRPANSTHNLTFTLGALKQNEMNDLKNRGYPFCTESNAPANCLARTLYGDNAVCAVGTPVGDEQMYATRVSHTCDASRGHSGGPLYQYINGVPTLAGIHISDAGVTQAIDPNNWMRHVTPTLITTINNTIPTL